MYQRSQAQSKKNSKFQISSKLLKSSGNKELTVILDLDNTLISSFDLQQSPNICDFLFTLPNGDQMSKIGVIKRPDVDLFLMTLSKFATIYLFTAATKEYASEIIRQIDPIGIYFTKVFTREHCTKENEKKLKKNYSICGTNMSRTLIVDDIPENFKDYSCNGIPIKPFRGAVNDDGLSQVFQQIIYLSGFSDVRRGFRI